MRQNKIKAAAAAAMGVGALVMAFALSSLLFGGSDSNTDRPLADPTLGAPLDVQPDDLNLTEQDPQLPPVAGDGAPGFPGAGINLTGLSGEGGIAGIPKHTIVLSVTSPGPIPYVGYVVPTSLDNSTGTVKEPGASWSLTTIGYGPPDYAQLFSLSGPTAVPITCTITVDGKVTEKRTTTGPYDQLFCQG